MISKFSHHRTLILAISSATIALGVPVVALSAAPAGAASSLCQRVSLAEVSSTLGVKATKITPVLNGNVTLCWYKVGANADAVYVRSQTAATMSVFTANKTSAKKQGEQPINDAHFSPYIAFSTSLGSPAFGYTYAVTVLKKSTQLDVGATRVSLAKVEALAKKVLPLIS
jgi:hypothetical protein